MPRPREFDEDEALSRAVDVFWRRGYEATSMRDLLGAMGLGRQSLYDTFGGKRALFLRAVDRYRRDTAARIEALYGPDAGVEAIRAHFEFVMEHIVGRPEIGACMMANTALELGLVDEEATSVVRRHLAGCEEAIHDALVRATRVGDVDADLDPRAVARYLTAALHGLGVMARSGASPEALRQVVDVTLSVLRPPAD
ncbi:MAG: TetR/AcrR family transcriptional regulator [Myxococcota bacterium]